MRPERALRRMSARFLVACLLVLAAPVHAEKTDRSKPIHLEADRVTVDDAKQIATFTGNVVLTQGTMVLRGDRMEVRQDKNGFRQGTTWGNPAYFRQKRDNADELIEGWAERIEYDSRSDKVQLFNRATLKRGQDQVQGNFISYDSATEFFQVSGGSPSAAGAGKSSDTRVRAILQPKAKEPPSRPGVKLKPDSAETVPDGDADGGSK